MSAPQSSQSPRSSEAGDRVEPIALVGWSGRFSGAGSIDELWRNLCGGVESIARFSRDELLEAGIPAEQIDDPSYVPARGILEGIDLFDAEFFGYTPREAALLDPQHRLFLECCWEALESAGHEPARFPGRVGVFAGTRTSGYFLHNLLASVGYSESFTDLAVALGNAQDFLTTRVSYKLGLKGPSVDVQTACSTSLVAVHLACQSLWTHECDMALAGGVSIPLPQKAGYLHVEGSIESPDGKCRAFDARAGGTVTGSGLGVVALRRLEDALADGDSILAVVLGSAINNDGSGKVGFTAPSQDGQAQVIAEALAVAGVEPDTIGFVEAHGTATALGDPVEVAALEQAFRSRSPRRCAIGSIKTNLGHLDPAAGVAGLIKAALVVRHGVIPPSLGFEKPNPQIAFDAGPFWVNSRRVDWPAERRPRRAGVSSFGVGGTNAHVVLEEGAPTPADAPRSPWQLLTLSARSERALDAATGRLAAHLDARADVELADVAHTLQVGRRAFAHRRFAVCKDAADASAVLSGRATRRLHGGRVDASVRSVALLFPGQGAQHVGMCRGLYEAFPVFRRELDRCAEILRAASDFDLVAALYAPAATDGALEQTRVAQPALFAVEYALARLWSSFGVEPAAMLGHSVGEYVAASLSGVFSVEDALGLVAERGRLMQAMLPGAMLAVGLARDELEPRLDRTLSLAAVNASRSCVVSGDAPSIRALEERLSRDGVACRGLHASHAFHSAMMDPVLAPFAECVAAVPRAAPRIPFVSNLTGTWITAEEARDPRYWADHLRHTVRFADGLDTLRRERAGALLLEVGPGQTLHTVATAATGDAASGASSVVAGARHPRSSEDDVAVLLTALGSLWSIGAPVDWRGYRDGERRRRVALPPYPFERRRHWIAAPHERRVAPGATRSAGERRDLADWFFVPTFRRGLPAENLPRNSPADEPSRWLVFLDAAGVAARIAARLRARGATVVTVEPGEGFGRLDEDRYAIAPGDPDDHRALFAALRGDRDPQAIVYATCGTLAAPESTAYHDLVCLARALGARADAGPVRLEVVADGLFAVMQGDVLCPSKATLLGPARVIPQEIAGVTCRVHDLALGLWPVSPPASPPASPQGPGDSLDALAERLELEMTSRPVNGVVAHRSGERWVPCYEPVRLERVEGVHARLRKGGVYLIAGGSVEPGLSFAERLADRGAKALVLIEHHASAHDGAPDGAQDGVRESVPPAAPSPEELRAAADRRRRVAALAARLALVETTCDLADRAQIERVADAAAARWGKIDGAIHAPGAVRAGLIQLETAATATATLAPFVDGTRVFYDVLAERGLEFLVLVGGSESWTGAFGQTNATAASAYRDTFARSKSAKSVQRTRASGPVVLAIDWPAWRDVALPTGATSPELQAMVRAMQENYGLTFAQGTECLERALATSLPQIVIARYEFDAIADEQRRFTHADFLDQLARHRPAVVADVEARPATARDVESPRTPVEAAVVAAWEELLGIRPIGIRDNFFDLGGNSLLAIQMVSRLRKQFDTGELLARFFESPTVLGLAQAIAGATLADAEAGELDALLSEIEGLSAEDVRAVLEREAAPEPGESAP